MRRQASRYVSVAALIAVLALVSGGAVPARGAGEPVKNPDSFVELQFGDVASLDPATSHSVLKYLQQINREGMTVICSLHFLSLARTYGTRVVALKGGQLVFDGRPAEIDEQRFKQIYGEEAVEVEIQ